MNRIIGVLIIASSALSAAIAVAQTEAANTETAPAATEAAAPETAAPAAGNATSADAGAAQPQASQPATSGAATPAPAPAPAAQPAPVPAPAAQPQAVAPPPPAPPSRYEAYEARLAYREAVRKERLQRKIEAKKRGRPLIMAGALSLGIGYMVSAVVASILVLDVDEPDAAFMYVPIVGNPIYFGRIIKEQRREEELYGDDPYYTDDDANFVLAMALFTPAIAQLTGTVLLSVGLAKRSRYKKEQANKPQVSVTPIMTPQTQGLSLSMTF